VVSVSRGSDLTEQLCEEGPFDLVIGESNLEGGSGLSLLARTHIRGCGAPFILVQSFHQSLMRILVGGAGSGVLGSRVVNEPALFELAVELVRASLSFHRHPAELIVAEEAV
jgi:hypothetical protein